MFEKSYAQQQAECDAAHLVQLLHKAGEIGLITRGKPDPEAAQKVIDDAANNQIRPRHDLLEPAKLLTKLADIRKTAIPKLTDRPGVNVNVSLKRAPREGIEDLTPIYACTEQSRRNNVFDVAVSAQGLVVRLENVLFVLSPQELYAAVADAFGMPLQRSGFRDGSTDDRHA